MAQKSENADKNNKFCVLIIEEKSDLRTFFMGVLTKSGNFEVKNAATPIEALDIVSKEAAQIHVILFDWDMKEMSGDVFAQKIKNEVNYDHIELVVCSAAIAQDDNFLLNELEIYHTMPKVVNAVDFLRNMEEIRAEYFNSQSIQTKIKNLKHLIHESDLQAIDSLFSNQEVENEITKNSKYTYLGGEVRILHKKYQEAIEFLKQHLEKNSANKLNENLKTLNTLGKALCLIGNFQDATMIYEKLEAKSPNNLSHKIMLGDALLGLDDVKGAENKYQEVLEKDNTNNAALEGMIKTNSTVGNFDQAKSFFDKIQGNFESKTLASFFNNRGVALVKNGKINEAIIFYENALQFFDKYKSHVYFNLGMAYYRSGNITSAVTCFQAAIAQDAKLAEEKVILRELKEKGAEKFTEDYQQALQKRKK
ncbi:tetratricopeptide repeat protein [Pigmentibacter sp. JX0631]|uniref:response regulator n=1 Tax=Pigmentibacter sp. JX0631 TaxID=2976982 RepID=UPI002469A1D7|nr:response regulator [Pigmentibacter sp. JX0631]WGL60005.1 tetratricopeptide repeat protein [Pigmentibacter sp. JX0631]